MSTSPEFIKRTRQSWDTEDLALAYIEEEIGRHDWANNWEKAKARGNVSSRIQEWLEAINVQHEPKEIVAYLDDMVKNRRGTWI